jgi:hypothetical protein
MGETFIFNRYTNAGLQPYAPLVFYCLECESHRKGIVLTSRTASPKRSDSQYVTFGLRGRTPSTDSHRVS